MFGDLLQAFNARTMVTAHGRTWLLCYLVPGESQQPMRLGLAVKCTEAGEIELPAEVHLIRLPDLGR